MNAGELRELRDDELLNHLEELRGAYYSQRFLLPSGALEKTHELQVKRREIARVLTVIRERELADA